MWEVVFSLIPVFGAAFYYFGFSAVLVSLAAIAGCLITEWWLDPRHGEALKDGSALITGMLLALCLPPGFPLWMAFLGGMVAIGLGKIIWGGLGQNIFNPALVGRAFLQSAFPTAITTWDLPDGRYLGPRGTNLALPLWQGTPVDAVTTATPLAKMKFDHDPTRLWDLLIGNTGGSLRGNLRVDPDPCRDLPDCPQDRQLAYSGSHPAGSSAAYAGIVSDRPAEVSFSCFYGSCRRVAAGRYLYGYRYGDVPADLQGALGVWHRDWDHRGADPRLGRLAGRRYVCHPAHERCYAVDQPGDQKPGVWALRG